MKILFAVVSCHKFRERDDVLRRTWVPDARKLGIDVAFFLGQGAAMREDEIILDVPDDYSNLRRKVQRTFALAVDQGYDFILKVDDDAVVLPEKWLASDFQSHDYVGHLRGPSGENGFLERDGVRYCSGFEVYRAEEKSYCSGFAYVLSNRAARIVADAPDNGDWAEDRFTGNALASSGILPHGNEEYIFWPTPCRAKFVIGDCPMCDWRYKNFIAICPYEQPDKLEGLYATYRKGGKFPTVHDACGSSDGHAL
jgi:Galactosyltransferase